MLIARKPGERLCDARNISAYDSWNVPKLNQHCTVVGGGDKTH